MVRFIKYILLSVFFLHVFYWSVKGSCEEKKNQKLIISFMEIKSTSTGAGLAVIIQTPGGRTYLYDTGPGQYPNESFDAGRDMIAPFLKRNNIKIIDGVVITHAHKDHFGGFKYLMDNFDVKRLYDTGYSGCKNCETEYDDLYKPEYISKGGKYQLVKQGDTLNWDKDLEVVMLSPPPTYLKNYANEANANSMVIRIKYNKITILLTSDITIAGQEYLLKKFSAPDLKADVMSAPHHGYDSYLQLAEVVKPEIVIASCMNVSEEPALIAQNIYSKMGAEIYATCWNGTVQVVSDGVVYSVIAERNK